MTLYRDQNEVLAGPVVLGAAITSQTLNKYGRAVLKTIPTVPCDLGSLNYAVKYSGDSVRHGSLSAPFAHAVLDGSKITSISSSPYPCVTGQHVNFTIKVASGHTYSPLSVATGVLFVATHDK